MVSRATTRIELWQEYRNQINENINLQEAVKNSNSRLSILNERVDKVFPNYSNKYKSKIQPFHVKVEDLENIPKYPVGNVKKYLDAIDQLEGDENRISYNYENLNFSIKALDDAIAEMKDGLNKQKSYGGTNKTDGIEVEGVEIVDIKDDKQIIPFQVAIDGPSGSGKSSVAKKIAIEYNLNYLNTGLVYRAIALKAIVAKLNIEDEVEFIKNFDSSTIALDVDEKVVLDGKTVSSELRSDQVSQLSSKLASYKLVRKYAFDVQQEYIKKFKRVVADGRDTTFRIMPKANVKIYLDTTPEVRAKRRVLQNDELGYSTDYDHILSEIIERDQRDKEREEDPLQISKGSIVIDASDMTMNQVIDKIGKLIKKKESKK